MSTQIWIDLDIKNVIDSMAECGADVTELRARYESLSKSVPAKRRRDAPEWQALREAAIDADRAADTGEPSALEAIRASRTEDRKDRYPTETGAWEDRVAGGWFGRIAGCILGKPVECLMREEDSRARLKELLEAAGEYPLRGFISQTTIQPYWESRGRINWFRDGHPCLRGQIRFAERDDDLDYTVLALRTVEAHGRDFTPNRVIDGWLRFLPYSLTYTAERIAYRNRILGMGYPETATFLNPYREWIGAQIRADLYGYICPGAPEDAAGLAWQDAACSHVQNGIYGAMWVSAAIAAAFCEDNPESIILRGLEQVPAECRFADHMRRTVDAARANGNDFEATFDDIHRRLGHYHSVHTINNACVVAAGLMHGARDFGRTICIAVMGGLDTDCNGATAGSIAGVMLGKDRLPERWTELFNDELHTAVQGCSVLQISDLIRRTCDLAAAGVD